LIRIGFLPNCVNPLILNEKPLITMQVKSEVFIYF